MKNMIQNTSTMLMLITLMILLDGRKECNGYLINRIQWNVTDNKLPSFETRELMTNKKNNDKTKTRKSNRTFAKTDRNDGTNPTFQTQELDAIDWGLDRIDQTRLERRRFNSKYRYTYTGVGVHVFIVDSGILGTHEEFRLETPDVTSGLITRVVCAKNYRLDLNETCDDKWGHGTYVAGIIGGTTYGVAKDVKLYSLKVFGSDGTCRFSDLIDSIKFVTEIKVLSPNQLIIINLSLGTNRQSKSLNDVVSNATNVGIPVVVAAGNGGVDACTYSPASIPDAITVATTDQRDRVWASSNYGKCVDIFAPGVAIRSSWICKNYTNSNNSTNVISGTSVSAPYVTGVIALYMERYPNATPYELRQLLIDDAQKDVIHFKKVKDDTQNEDSIVRSKSVQQYVRSKKSVQFHFPTKDSLDKIKNIFDKTITGKSTTRTEVSESPNRLLNVQGVLTLPASKPTTTQLTGKPVMKPIQVSRPSSRNPLTRTPTISLTTKKQPVKYPMTIKSSPKPSILLLTIKPVISPLTGNPIITPSVSKSTQVSKTTQPTYQPAPAVTIGTVNPLIASVSSSLLPTNKLTLLEMTRNPTIVQTIVPTAFVVGTTMSSSSSSSSPVDSTRGGVAGMENAEENSSIQSNDTSGAVFFTVYCQFLFVLNSIVVLSLCLLPILL